MKRTFTFTPVELNEIVYEIQEIEKQFQAAKDDYDVLEDSSKDLLAEYKTMVDAMNPEKKTSEIELERLARSDTRWKNFKIGLHEAQRKYGQLSVRYKHLLRVLDVLTSGLAFNRELLKKGVHDISGK